MYLFNKPNYNFLWLVLYNLHRTLKLKLSKPQQGYCCLFTTQSFKFIVTQLHYIPRSSQYKPVSCIVQRKFVLSSIFMYMYSPLRHITSSIFMYMHTSLRHTTSNIFMYMYTPLRRTKSKHTSYIRHLGPDAQMYYSAMVNLALYARWYQYLYGESSTIRQMVPISLW